MSSLGSNSSGFYSQQPSISQTSCSDISVAFNPKDLKRLDKIYDDLSRSLLEKRCRKVQLLEKIKQKIWKREEIKQSIALRRKMQQEKILGKRLQLQNRLLLQLKDYNAAKQSIQQIEAESDKNKRDENFEVNFCRAKELLCLKQENNQIKSSIQKIINLINPSSQKQNQQQQQSLNRERATLLSKYKLQKQDLLKSINPYQASGHQLLVMYSLVLKKFKQCDSDKYKETLVQQKHFIYVFKRNNPNVIVRIQEPIEKVHGWTFKEIEVFQRLNDNPKVFHWKRVALPFRGELILTILEDFNRSIKHEIQQAIPRRTNYLDKWLSSGIDDIFQIKEKSQKNFDNTHSFMEIKTLYRDRYKNYFQARSWRSSAWEGLLDIANSERLQQNRSFGIQLDQISAFISNYEVINDQHYQGMFELGGKKKATKQRPKDKYELEYERRILLKYGLKEYLDT